MELLGVAGIGFFLYLCVLFGKGAENTTNPNKSTNEEVLNHVEDTKKKLAEQAKSTASDAAYKKLAKRYEQLEREVGANAHRASDAYHKGYAEGIAAGRSENKELQDKDFAKRVRSAMSSLTKSITEKYCSNVISINGYSQATLRRHIEKQFTDGMSWTNRDEWHIDHIKPVSLWITEGVTNIKIINALSNLKPIWAKENLEKSAKYDSTKDHPVHVCPSVYA